MPPIIREVGRASVPPRRRPYRAERRVARFQPAAATIRLLPPAAAGLAAGVMRGPKR
jgi:hypothetical protein